MDLWESANKALEDLLTTKASINACRQRAIWELNMILHQNESQAAKTIKEAKAACSQVTLDTLTTCSWLILEPKTTCSMAVREAKTTRGHLIQEAKATCFKAISEAEAQRISQAELFQREHDTIMWNLEEHAILEECRSRADFLFTCQAALYTSPLELKSTLAASSHILLGQTSPSPLLAPLQRTSPVEEQPPLATLPTPMPKQSPRPKRRHPSPDPMESMPLGGATPKVNPGGPPSSKR